jgi:hypothetical protein
MNKQSNSIALFPVAAPVFTVIFSEQRFQIFIPLGLTETNSLTAYLPPTKINLLAPEFDI